MTINFRATTFYASYSDTKQMDVLSHPQIAFVGRSNAGKSSLLNALCDNKKLARTSNSPGRTQTIVVFSLQEPYFLVDLPGYGYAKVSKHMRQSWGHLIEQYMACATRINGHGLLGLVIAVDSRRLLQDMDRKMLEFARFYEMKTCVFLTKGDKLTQQQKQQGLKQVQKELQSDKQVSVMMGSSVHSKPGTAQLAHWITEKFVPLNSAGKIS